MKTSTGWFVMALAACGAPVAVRPQVVAPVPVPVTAAVLERRVPDALFARGVALSRQGMSLRIEQLGEQWQVSLVDLYTGQVMASAEVAVLADREAAVASLTRRVTRLIAQAKGEPVPAAEQPAAEQPAAEQPAAEQPVAHADQAAAEDRFRREAIHFDTEPVVASEGNTITQPRWKVWQGDPSQEMSDRSFYRAIERPELYTSYQHRRTATFISYAVSGAMLVSGALIRAWGHDGNRDFGSGLLIFGGVGGAISIGLAASQHPIALADAKALADAYNRRLRTQLGLPDAAAPSVVRAIHVAPYVAPAGAGVALGGRF